MKDPLVIDMQPVSAPEQAPQQRSPETRVASAALDPSIDKGAIAEAAAAEFADRFRKPREERIARGEPRRREIAARAAAFFSRFDRIIDAGLGSPVVDAVIDKVNAIRGGIAGAREKLAQKFAAGKQATLERVQKVKDKAKLAGLEMYAPVADTMVRAWNLPEIFQRGRAAERAGRLAEQFKQSQSSADAKLAKIAEHKAAIAAIEEDLKLDTSAYREGEQEQVASMWEHLSRQKEARDRRSSARAALDGLKRAA